MKISNTIIISIASILIVAICSETALRLHEKSAENPNRIDTVDLTDKDRIEMLVTLNSHRLELVKTIMDGDSFFSDEMMKSFDEEIEKNGLKVFNKKYIDEAIDRYWKTKKAKSIIEHAIFLERAMSDIVMNDSLIKMKRRIELGM